MVDEPGLRRDPDKVQPILQVSPINVKKARHFIGTTSWSPLSTEIWLLTNQTKKYVRWSWSPECEKAFETLQEYLVTAPSVLARPDVERTFYLQTDVYAYGIGIVGERVIYYLPRSLTAQEKQYRTTEREFLAVLWVKKKFHHYLKGFYFKVIADCHSLVWLQNLHKFIRTIIGRRPWSVSTSLLYCNFNLYSFPAVLGRFPGKFCFLSESDYIFVLVINRTQVSCLSSPSFLESYGS